MTFRTIHRFIPATTKHGIKTACGIKLLTGPLVEDGNVVIEAITSDGGFVVISNKGKPFDCKRCRFILERHHAKEAARS
jgi:hypothetical protein